MGGTQATITQRAGERQGCNCPPSHQPGAYGYLSLMWCLLRVDFSGSLSGGCYGVAYRLAEGHVVAVAAERTEGHDVCARCYPLMEELDDS